jgi:hypothetical protein
MYCDGEVDQYDYIHLDDENMGTSTPPPFVRPQITDNSHSCSW